MKKTLSPSIASPLPHTAAIVKVEKDTPTPDSLVTRCSPPVPVNKMGNGGGPTAPGLLQHAYPPSLGSPIGAGEQKPISLSKLMQARAQRNQDFYQATGIFSFELHRQTNHNDSKMPESPVDQSNSATKSSTGTTLTSTLVPHSMGPGSRTLSTSSSTGSLLNGVHSPHSVNGTPSPPTTVPGGAAPTTNTPSSGGQQQDLPPACGARQLSKLKRFLTTLQQFGTDISPEIGERVRSLVMGLVNNALTVEEFHNKLQEATNFPLRPFVIPFLKANLPLLQRELMHCARLAKVNPQQYYLQHEQQILEVKNTAEPTENEINENGKRRSPDDRITSRSKENSSSSGIEVPLPKRHQGSPPGGMPPSANPFSHLPPHPFRVEDMVPPGGREPREFREMRENLERERERHASFGFPPSRESLFPDPFYFDDRIEDEWKHVETMLQCIVGMVEKTKRALAVLHQRSVQDREELALWARRQSVDRNFNKRPSGGDSTAAAVSPVEDRVTEVKRRAEEAVNEVKRQAVSELQKAVAAAELKANEMVSAERAKLDQSIVEARQKAAEEALSLLNQQEDSSENCWNCGRKANETCSGCNTARYCGSFCQHKDWENHHRMCSQYVSQSKGGTSSKTAVSESTTSSSSKSMPMPPASVSLMRSSPPTASPSGTSSRLSTASPRTAGTPPGRLQIPVEGAR